MTKFISESTLAGKAIRKELKANFPGIKFSVYQTAAFNINVSWDNNPTREQVNKIVSKYKMGNFDGMCDSYDFSNRRHDIPQVEYIFLIKN